MDGKVYKCAQSTLIDQHRPTVSLIHLHLHSRSPRTSLLRIFASSHPATRHLSPTMQFKTLALALLAAASTSLAATVSVSYDETYDNASASLTSVACSDGTNGLITKGFSSFGSLPQFPNIGGASAIAGWNDAACGTCWTLTYNGRSINVLAIDHAGSGFNVALAAMNTLTNNQAAALGRINAEATQVAASVCGL